MPCNKLHTLFRPRAGRLTSELRQWSASIIPGSVLSFRTRAFSVASSSAMPAPRLEVIQQLGENQSPREAQDISKMPPHAVADLLINAAATGETSLHLWSAGATRLAATVTQLGPQQAANVLKSFQQVGMFDKELLVAAANVFLRGYRQLKPTTIASIIYLYDEAEVRPERLFTCLIRYLESAAETLYGEEVTFVLTTFALMKLANQDLLAGIARAVGRGISRFTFSQLTVIFATFRSLGLQSKILFSLLDERAKLEAQLMPLQELVESVADIQQLEFSWEPYEALLLDELRERIKSFDRTSIRGIEELSDPLAAVGFFEKLRIISVPFLEALALWSEKMMRSPRPRITAESLLHLHDLFREYDLDPDKLLGDALRRAVSGARHPIGSSGPLKFIRRNRRYIWTQDPLEAAKLKVKRLPTPEESLKALQLNFQQSNTPEVPPGLVLKSLPSRTLVEKPHLGALWNATLSVPRQRSSRDPELRFAPHKRAKAFKNRPVKGYTSPEEPPLRHPRKWI